MPADFAIGPAKKRRKVRPKNPKTQGVGPVKSGREYGRMLEQRKREQQQAKRSEQGMARAGVGASQVKPPKVTAPADRKVKRAIEDLPPVQRQVERARYKHRKEESKARQDAARAVIRLRYDLKHNRAPSVDAETLREAVRRGETRIGGKHGLQRKVDLEVTPAGDIAMRMDRRFLPDTRQIVVPADYKPGRKYTKKQTAGLIERQQEYHGVKKAETPAGKVAGKALDIVSRPAYAVASGVDAAVKGKNVAKGAKAGLTGKSKTLFGDILKDAGLPAGIAAVAGFGLDVVLDPTTYVTFGAGSVARREAVAAAKRAHRKALASGLTREQAERMGARAAAQTMKKTAGKGKGAVVRVAGREVPGVRKATAPAGRAVRKVTAGRGKRARDIVGDVNPNLPPAGVSREAADEAAQAARTARARVSRDAARADREAVALRKQIGEGNYQRVIDAVEAGKIGSLPDELREAAVFFRSRMRYANRQRRHAGIKGGERRNYVPHVRTPESLKAERQTGVGKRVVQPGHAKRRTDTRPLAEIRQTSPGKFSEDIPAIYSHRMREGARAQHQAGLNRRLADIGEDVKPGREVLLPEGVSVYHLKGSDLKKLDSKDVARLEAGKLPGGGGRYVALDDKLVDRAMSSYKAAPAAAGGIGRVYDKLQGTWKSVALATPGFHIRNLIGDTQNAYLAESAPRLARNIVHSRRALKRLNKQENAQRTLGASAKPSRMLSRGGMKADPTKSGLKIQGRFMTYDDLAREAVDHGAVRSGFISREIPELLTGNQPAKGAKRVRGKAATRHVSRALQNREDLIRLATYIGGRKRGLSPEKASARAMKYHFDYAQLTDFERNVARRIMPFYTWSARNIPLQARSIVQRPGKYANYEKFRQEAANAAGLPDDWENYLEDWERRQVGVPVKIGGRVHVLTWGSPVSDLNELPGLLSPSDQLDEWFEKFASLWSPLIKNPVELFANYSFFFRNQIENDQSPLVAAPDWVGLLPAAVRKNLGIVRGIDRRSGREVWKWPGKAQYLAKSIPGMLLQVQNLATTGTDRRGRGTAERVAGLLGVTVIPIDKVSKQINDLFAELGRVNDKQARLRQQSHNGKPISADNPTPEYTRLLEEVDRINRRLYELMKKRGDADPSGKPPPVSELSPAEQLQREFDQFRNQSPEDQARELQREFEQFLKSGGG